MQTQPTGGTGTGHLVCRVCNKGCPMIAKVRDGRLVSVHGDPDNELYQGFTCLKGRAMPTVINGPGRLLHSLRRSRDGFEPIPVETAMDEIAARLCEIVDKHGGRAVATWNGTQTQNFPTPALMQAFSAAIGSPMKFGSFTVDKPGRAIAWAMLGKWQAPPQGFVATDVAMMIGINPLINGLGGIPSGHPGNWLSERLRAGMELIVIDPRRCHIAERATLFLQPRPGHDIPILAAMLNVILTERLHDEPFTAENVRNLDALHSAVRAFDPREVAARAGLAPAELERAARTFARAGRGYVVAGTGPHFAGQGTLLEYLALCLDTVCGHWMRAGEVAPNVGVLNPPISPRAQANDPVAAYGFGARSRVRGLGLSVAGMPGATLAEEILIDGPDRVRALLSCGGNPLAALPGHEQTFRAFERLDLLVQVDPFMSQTAELADYVIAPKMTPEMIGMTIRIEQSPGYYATGYGYPADYAQYSEPVVDPPADSEVIEDWEFFYGLAQRMHLDLHVTNQAGESAPLDMHNLPPADELVAMLMEGSRVPLEQVKAYPSGAFFPADPPVVVAEKQDGWTGRLDVGDADMLSDLAAHAHFDGDEHYDYPFRLLCRRMPHVVNSSYNARVAAGRPGPNPAFMNSADLMSLGLVKGQEIEIESAHGAIVALADVDDGLRDGSVSMMFGFGGARDDDHRHIHSVGSSVARLLSSSDYFDPYSGQPRMSSIPIRIRAATRPIERRADHAADLGHTNGLDRASEIDEQVPDEDRAAADHAWISPNPAVKTAGTDALT
jgi:anaerobic selenocysteine-containing dehydrogenase